MSVLAGLLDEYRRSLKKPKVQARLALTEREIEASYSNSCLTVPSSLMALEMSRAPTLEVFICGR
jgi:hypothetical protein